MSLYGTFWRGASGTLEAGGTSPQNHGSYLEAMASGPALAQGLRTVAQTPAPRRIIVGGGLPQATGFNEALRVARCALPFGYPAPSECAASDSAGAPGLSVRSGLAGGLVVVEGIHPG